MGMGLFVNERELVSQFENIFMISDGGNMINKKIKYYR